MGNREAAEEKKRKTSGQNERRSGQPGGRQEERRSGLPDARQADQESEFPEDRQDDLESELPDGLLKADCRERKGPGRLYLCATPIGNLEDITFRVVRTLKEVDLIAAEDTRNSIHLCTHFDIHTPLTSYHEYNRFDKARVLVEKMKEGLNVAVITDAGTPGISDPGEELVRQALAAGISVTSLPGACACVTALTMSGQATRRFAFEAFLPPEKKERRAILEELKEETRTIVLYEAPHRLKETLEELKTVLGEDRAMTVTKELTKLHETVLPTTLGGACRYFETEQPRGEYVLVIAGRDRKEIEAEEQKSWEEMSAAEHVLFYEKSGLDRKEAMKKAAKDRGVSRREIYQALLEEEQ